MRTVPLAFGRSGRIELILDESRLRGVLTGPAGREDLPAHIVAAFDAPIDYPPLEQSVIADDTITLALDHHVPAVELVIAEIWRRLAGRGVDPSRVTILQPATQPHISPDYTSLPDPRAALPAGVRDKVRWELHSPVLEAEAEGKLRYLATTAAGERTYLSSTLLDADVAVSIGTVGFDSLLGYRGTNSVFYPGLSSVEAIRKTRGAGHSELDPADSRPLRQLVDEVGWLLGAPFSIQVIPAANDGVAAVLTGATEAVLRRGCDLLAEHWTLQLPERAETVVVAVTAEAGRHGWDQVAAALSVARSLVARDGRIVVLSQLAERPGEGLEFLTRCESPRDALRPLRKAMTADFETASRWAEATDWARVFLLSDLESDLVEDLFCVPLEGPDELARLLAGGDESCVILGSAQQAYAGVTA